MSWVGLLEVRINANRELLSETVRIVNNYCHSFFVIRFLCFDWIILDINRCLHRFNRITWFEEMSSETITKTTRSMRSWNRSILMIYILVNRKYVYIYTWKVLYCTCIILTIVHWPVKTNLSFDLDLKFRNSPAGIELLI